jgi:hypothetical protein
VNNSAAFAGIETAGVAYCFHRTGHHTIERRFSLVHVGVTGFDDVRNYALESRHRRQLRTDSDVATTKLPA